ncbi:MaoC family dehydratase [Rubrobacter tropicus]|uniref:MaoC family dehydratase n=1 Tax=Rubrobacter tropicus TaxID=2653851 RepID=A0A6G8Q6J4_9ACTN|nr:MaoC family dehydratase N-terminal domain-containing protein [Rubrobacter tropicus]QIN82073.1 MaoC family dehydratase [Rubrobacter tropicus]
MLYEEFVGRPSEPVRNVVERDAVRLFAEAIADPSPLYRDEEVARLSRYGRIPAPPTFVRTFDYGKVEGLELPPAGLIHGEFRISYERPLLVGDEILCRLTLKDSYDKHGRRGLLGFLLFERRGEDPEGNLVFTTNDTVVVTEAVRRGIKP